MWWFKDVEYCVDTVDTARSPAPATNHVSPSRVVNNCTCLARQHRNLKLASLVDTDLCDLLRESLEPPVLAQVIPANIGTNN